MSINSQINGTVITSTSTTSQTSTSVITNTSSTVTASQGPTLKTVRSSIISNSYMFNTNLSSSSNLSHRSSECKPVPPPTLPKYTSSFNSGQKSLDNQQSQTSTFYDRDKDGMTGSSYRIAALERLAMRQRIRDSNNCSIPTTPTLITAVTTVTTSPSVTTVSNVSHNMLTNGSLTNGVSSNESISPSPSNDSNSASTANLTTQLQLKRDLFFSSSSVSGSKKTESKESISPQPPPKPEQSAVRAKVRHLEGYVGFANLPNQVYRKAVKQGFEFTLMVVGESGLGKSTLINSMFLTDIYSNEYPGPSLRIKKTVSVETTKVLLKEKGVNLKLTVVDTPGFGDAVDNSNCWVPILDFIDAKYDDYLNSESRVNRTSQIPDQRVHCCLYFLQPTGHGLKSLDIEFMKRLCDKVNIVPVIAKADTLTTEECQSLKKQIMMEIDQHDIKIYTFPDMNEDEDDHKLNKNLKDRVPFAVVGSNTVIEVADGQKVRGRKYPWGVVEVDSLEHCDFLALRNMIVQIHLQDLKDVTNNVHYENFRWRKLAGLGFDSNKPMSYKWNLLEQVDEEKREREEKMKAMEQEMELVFEQKVKEKIQKVKNSEAEMMKRHEATRRSLEEQAKEMEEKRRQFDLEKQQWERDNSITIEELQRKSLEGSKETLDGKKDKKKKGLF